MALVTSTFAIHGVAQSAPTAPVGRSERTEVRFLEGMSDHHQMAIDMAQDCLKKAVTDDLRKLCQSIIDAQSAEIKTMHDWLLTWYNIDYMTMPMPQMMSQMQGMESTATPETQVGAVTDPAGMMGMMAGLSRLQGNDYEVAFLESMIDHHDDAVHMSERVLKIAQHPALIDQANKIIKDQKAEIEEMEKMISARGG